MSVYLSYFSFGNYVLLISVCFVKKQVYFTTEALNPRIIWVFVHQNIIEQKIRNLPTKVFITFLYLFVDSFSVCFKHIITIRCRSLHAFELLILINVNLFFNFNSFLHDFYFAFVLFSPSLNQATYLGTVLLRTLPLVCTAASAMTLTSTIPCLRNNLARILKSEPRGPFLTRMRGNKENLRLTIKWWISEASKGVGFSPLLLVLWICLC